jgi:hypothetical protein
MEEQERNGDETRESAEEPGAESAGEGDEHSKAPGETGTGSREGDPEHGKPYRP